MANTQQYISAAQAEFASAMDHLKVEYARMQMGRATPSLVEDLQVEAYGQMQPMKAVASISVADARTLAIQPWDRSTMGPIEKAILAANLGLNPVNDGKLIRIPLPALTEERRRDLVKVVHQLEEQAKISVRTARGTAHSAFKTMEEAKEVTEDERRHGEKVLQEHVDAMNKELEELAKKKEQDIMTV
ncbi:ribosome recycling factor [Candidatus Gracilibacteria bacterium]|nr:ribosome recycling factor [Candidatus Gracilibacteria bacterium]